MYPGRHIDIHADVNVLELRIDQWIDHARACANAHADSGLKAARRHRNAISDFERGFFAVAHADFGILDDPRFVIGKNCVRGCARQCGAVIRAGKISQVIECDLSGVDWRG